MVAVQRELPNFGGLFFDSSGVAHVRLRAQAPAGERAAAVEFAKRLAGDGRSAHLPPTLGEGPEAIVESADYSFAELVALRDRAGGAMALKGALSLDANEQQNRVSIGVADEVAAERVASWWASSGLPALALDIAIEEPVRPFRTLREAVRPVPGGVQIDTSYGEVGDCTLGYSVFHNGRAETGFITNSHCTLTQGGNENTWFAQAGGAWFWADKIGEERLDPYYLSTVGGCPAGRLCRRSDSAYARYDNAGSANRGRIARTLTWCSLPTVYCTVEVSPFSPDLRVTGVAGFPAVGNILDKMGRTTGWTYGSVSQTCVTVNVDGTTLTFICQDRVAAGADYGDSGSPVFVWGGATVQASGILWGGSGNTNFVFSHLDEVSGELGSMNYLAP